MKTNEIKNICKLWKYFFGKSVLLKKIETRKLKLEVIIRNEQIEI